MAKDTYLHDTLDLCTQAGIVLKRIGFVHHKTSLKTEAVYYKWPGFNHVLRVSTHKRKNPYLGLDPVAAKLTFNGNCLDRDGTIRLAEGAFQTLIANAVGRYFLKATAPSPVKADP